MLAFDAPISIGRVTLLVNDLDRMNRFYEEIVGLNLISRDRQTAVLGASEMPLFQERLWGMFSLGWRHSCGR